VFFWNSPVCFESVYYESVADVSYPGQVFIAFDFKDANLTLLRFSWKQRTCAFSLQKYWHKAGSQEVSLSAEDPSSQLADEESRLLDASQLMQFGVEYASTVLDANPLLM
jgi:hypothetical protein